MNKTNYHSHTQFCDGRADMEDFVLEAIGQGFYSYGFSPHAPLPFRTEWTMDSKEAVADYITEFNRLKTKYADEIELYAGMEIDYLNEKHNPACDFFKQLPLDYRIGSVHMLHTKDGEIVDIDCDAETFKCRLERYFENDLEALVRLYYKQLLRMIELGGFDIVGHADKMSHNASFCQPDIREQKWYDDIMTHYFETIAQKKLMVEINTKQFERFGMFFPNKKYFALLRELKIPVLVNSDSHEPHLINSGRGEALKELRAAGIRSVMELDGGVWVEKEIEI